MGRSREHLRNREVRLAAEEIGLVSRYAPAHLLHCLSPRYLQSKLRLLSALTPGKGAQSA